MIKTHVFPVLAGVLTAGTVLTAEDVDWKKIPEPADKKVDFVKDIKPLFEVSCLKCHGEKRPKSKYRMDTREFTIQGGRSGDPAIVVKDSKKSLLVHYIADAVEEMEMPPVDKRETYPAFTKEQVALVRAWIDQGALWPEKLVLEYREPAPKAEN